MDYIKYENPATDWSEALPVGNGYTGVMAYGSLEKETLCFNDCTLWSSYPKCNDVDNGYEYLKKVRHLIISGKNRKADKLAEDKLVGSWSATYLPLGNVNLDFAGLNQDNYERKLDFKNAIHSVTASGIKCELFASYPKNVVAYNIKSDNAFNVRITADSLLNHKVTTDDGLNLFGNAPDKIFPLNHDAKDGNNVLYNENKAMAYALRLEVETDGSVKYNDDSISVENAKKLIIYFVTQTGFKAFNEMPETDTKVVLEKCKDRLLKLDKNYDLIRQEHITDFSELYSKQSLKICEECDLTASEIIKNAQNGGTLEMLSQIMYNFGKYLLISGSRMGTQPLNLQGIWNSKIRPPWSCNYTTNINTQMNYWASSSCGLSACIEPLIRMMEESIITGSHTAKTMFGAEGFCCNHNMDIWRKTSPSMGSAQWFLSPLCGAWLTNELYRHYLDGGLEEYRDTIFKIVRENAKFLMSYLIKLNGKYVICPSTSPENSFRYVFSLASLDIGTAYDMGITRYSLENALEICENKEEKEKLKKYLDHLYPIKKGKHGVREFYRNYFENEPGHRHFSPLYAFYPANEIGYNSDKERTQWVSELFWHRLDNSHQHVGWSAVWAMCIGARLRDVRAEQKVIRHFITNAIFNNLFCYHEPDYFQIDGNFGFVAGLNELLITEEKGKIEFLPAILPEYKNGKMDNIIIRGAKISFEWKDGKVIKIDSDKPIKVYNRHLSENLIVSNNIDII